MPITFIDIEKQKTWRILVFFFVLMFLYFVVCITLALPLMPHAVFFPSASALRHVLPYALLIAFVAAGIHFFFAGYNAVTSVISNLKAQPPDMNDEVHKTLFNIMQEINIVSGAEKKIECVVIPTLSMNALAAADLQGRAVIGVTEGLLSRLTRPQLEAVVAHEAHHILSGDCLETTVAASLFGSLSSLVDKYSALNNNRVYLPPVLWPAWIALKASYLLNMFISREREYRADAAAVRMTRNPVALAEALYLLSRNWRGAGFIGSGFEMLCIVNPTATALDETEGFWADLVSTHPPIQKRIDVLLTMAHMNIAALDTKLNGRIKTASALGPALYHAMDPQQQWQGPFTLTELGALAWLSPLTWVRTGDQQAIERAWKNDFLNALFVSRLSQSEKKTSDMTCPACQTPLTLESYEGTQVYQCRFCAGTLVDTEKIPRILARTGQDRSCSERLKALSRTTLEKNQLAFAQQRLLKQHKSVVPLLACPKCKQPMYRGFYSGAYLIEIDRCSFCNITWFNQDELEMLQCLIGNSQESS